MTNTGTEYYNSNVNLMLIDENGYIAYSTDQSYYYTPSYVSVAPEYQTIEGSLGNLTMSINLDNPSSTDYVGTVGALVFNENANYCKMLDAKQVELTAGGSGTVILIPNS